MFKFFLIVFDTRRLHQGSMALDEIDEIEHAALDAFVKFVIKLSEKTFKPLFLSFVDWASTKADGDNGEEQGQDNKLNDARLIIFYRAVNKLFENLRSLTTPYYSSILDLTIQQLERYAIKGDTLEVEEEERRKEVPIPDQLWREVILSILRCATHDTTNFWSNDTFTKVCKPLADQLPNTKVSSDSDDVNSTDIYIERINSVLAPSMGQLALSVNNDVMWKMLNSRVMLKSRSEDAAPVWLTLCPPRVLSQLGEEFLILLPETIPFPAELMEDDDPRVECLTQETILNSIELYLGESCNLISINLGLVNCFPLPKINTDGSTRLGKQFPASFLCNF